MTSYYCPVVNILSTTSRNSQDSQPTVGSILGNKGRAARMLLKLLEESVLGRGGGIIEPGLSVDPWNLIRIEVFTRRRYCCRCALVLGQTCHINVLSTARALDEWRRAGDPCGYFHPSFTILPSNSICVARYCVVSQVRFSNTFPDRLEMQSWVSGWRDISYSVI